jgi:Helix-turn-helix domain
MTEATLSVSKAAELTGMDRRTITRYADQGRFPNAERSHGREGPGSGPWRIPPGDLAAAGLIVDSSAVEEVDLGEVEALRAEVEMLHESLTDFQRRVEVAEAVARERLSHISDLRATIKELVAERKRSR